MTYTRDDGRILPPVYEMPETHMLSVNGWGYIPDDLPTHIVPYIIAECCDLGEDFYPIHVGCLKHIGLGKIAADVQSLAVGHVADINGYRFVRESPNFCSMRRL